MTSYKRCKIKMQEINDGMSTNKKEEIENLDGEL